MLRPSRARNGADAGQGDVGHGSVRNRDRLSATARSLQAAVAMGIVAAGAASLASRRNRRLDRAMAEAVARLDAAVAGDLDTPVPSCTTTAWPKLAAAVDRLFERQRAELDRIEQMAWYDPVTGLPNRASFRSSCESRIAALPADAAAALLFIDLDGFKAVNDTKGHAVGDLLLAQVADRLRIAADAVIEAEAADALVGRLAGDEFTVFLGGFADPSLPERVAGRIVEALAEAYRVAELQIQIGASVGVALFPDHGMNFPILMRNADAAMYRAKAAGRGRVARFDASIAADLQARAALDAELRRAVDRREFLLAFQPQISFDHGGCVAVEALLRWRHPRDGIRMPGAFLDRAEDSGVIVEIGDWVVAEVAATIARWARRGIVARLAINVSPRQIGHAGFFHRLRAALHAAGAPANRLEIEMSETLATSCPPAMMSAIAALRADGATIAIDGFGAGQSSLARLGGLPLDRIKLDRSLIAPIADDPGARSIVHALISLVHGMGLEVVGEGIETQAQADVLRLLGCDVIQGYGVAEPMDEVALLAWLGPPARAAG